MNIRQAVKMAFKSILGNKGRSFLTMLGIIIGIASVMTIVSTVNGMNQESMKQFEAMGTNKINVSAMRYDGQDVFDDLYDYCSSLGTDLVLGFLQQLNKEGTTVILITHDNGIAATARRVVRLADGKIVDDHEQEVDWL